nr:MAG TPA: hypothetical protein [Caudoviricetes sp.]
MSVFIANLLLLTMLLYHPNCLLSSRFQDLCSFDS